MELAVYLRPPILFPKIRQASLKEKIGGFRLVRWKMEHITLVFVFIVLLRKVR